MMHAICKHILTVHGASSAWVPGWRVPSNRRVGGRPGGNEDYYSKGWAHPGAAGDGDGVAAVVGGLQHGVLLGQGQAPPAADLALPPLWVRLLGQHLCAPPQPGPSHLNPDALEVYHLLREC